MRNAAKTLLGAVLAALVGISSIPLSHAQSGGGAGGAGGGSAGAGGAGAGTTGAAPGSSGTATGTVGSGTGNVSNGAGSIQGGANSTLNPSGNPALNPPPGTAPPGMGTSPRR